MIAEAALEFVFLILEMTFSLLSSRALVNDSAAILVTLARGSARSTRNSLWIPRN